MYRVDGVRASERRTLGQTRDAERRAGELHDEVLRRVLQVADEDLARLEALALQHGCRRCGSSLKRAKIQCESFCLAPQRDGRGPALRSGLC